MKPAQPAARNAASASRRTERAAPASPYLVELRNVSLRFGEKQVLDGVSLAVAPQERLVIIGQSGAGKTTILRLILGFLAPTTGSVFFKQLEIARLARHDLQRARRRIGMVYQDAALLSSSTVHENLALPLEELTDDRRDFASLRQATINPSPE